MNEFARPARLRAIACARAGRAAQNAPTPAATTADMTPISAIAQSGMSAALARLGGAAHNIANLGTQGFRRELVSQATIPGGGVTTTRSLAEQPGNALERDVVEQLAAKNSFLANLAVFRTSDEMLGSQLNIRA